MPEGEGAGSLRSDHWFNNGVEPDQDGVYLGRFSNYGLTGEELRSGRPIIGIAQTGSELTPCNYIHVQLVERVKAGIRDAGGVPIEFPVHPIQESVRRPTAALDRNLAYLGLVEVLAGNPFDGVVLTTGCDKTTPAALMAAATTDLPSIVLSGGPMLDSYWNGARVGSGMVLWEARRRLAAGLITEDEMVEELISLPPSAGHCNIMGTALSMNSIAELLGMTLPGSASIPAVYADRAKMAYRSGRRIVALAREGIRPSDVMTREALENAIVGTTALGGSSNCVPHLMAIAAHLGIPLTLDDWDRVGFEVSLLANVQPSGEFFSEDFHRAGGVAAVIGELLAAGRLHGDALTISGHTLAETYAGTRSVDHRVIRTYDEPLRSNAGFAVMRGNFMNSAILKTSVINEEFRLRYLSDPDQPGVFTARAAVFDGPEDYRRRIDDPELDINADSILIMRGAGQVGYPGAAEVVNMTPPARVVKTGVRMLPCMGDGRQSGTSDSPSILHVSPEAAVGGLIVAIEDGDLLRVDIPGRRIDVLVPDEELERRRAERGDYPVPPANTPWEELFRNHSTQLEDGGALDWAIKYRHVATARPRHSH